MVCDNCAVCALQVASPLRGLCIHPEVLGLLYDNDDDDDSLCIHPEVLGLLYDNDDNTSVFTQLVCLYDNDDNTSVFTQLVCCMMMMIIPLYSPSWSVV